MKYHYKERTKLKRRKLTRIEGEDRRLIGSRCSVRLGSKVFMKSSSLTTSNNNSFLILFLVTHLYYYSLTQHYKVKIEVNKIMNPAFLFGTAFNIANWHRKYHSGTICKGVSNPQTSNALSVWHGNHPWALASTPLQIYQRFLILLRKLSQHYF